MIIRYWSLTLLVLSGVYGSCALADVRPGNAENKSGLNSKLIKIGDEVNKFSCSANQDVFDMNNRNRKKAVDREKILSSVDAQLINSCLISTNEVQRRLLSRSVSLIDIRSAKEYESYRLPGSLNLSSYAIKSKDYLKSKHLVIVGDKVDLMEMGLLCRELKEQGFKKVNILKDGMSSWGKKLAGQNAELNNSWLFGKIEPREFTSLKSKMKWMVLDVSGEEVNKKELDFIYQGLDVVSFGVGDEGGLKKVKGFMSSQSDKNLYGILVISNHGSGYGEISKYLETNNIKNVYYMDGGLREFAIYLQGRKAFIARLKKGPANLMTCSNT